MDTDVSPFANLPNDAEPRLEPSLSQIPSTRAGWDEPLKTMAPRMVGGPRTNKWSSLCLRADGGVGGCRKFMAGGRMPWAWQMHGLQSEWNPPVNSTRRATPIGRPVERRARKEARDTAAAGLSIRMTRDESPQKENGKPSLYRLHDIRHAREEDTEEGSEEERGKTAHSHLTLPSHSPSGSIHWPARSVDILQ